MQGPQQFSHAAGGEWGFRKARCPGALPVGLDLLPVAKHVFPWLCSGVSPGLRVQAGSRLLPAPCKGAAEGREGTGFRERERSSLKQVISWSPLAHPHIPGKSLSVIKPGFKLVSFVVVWILSETYLTAVFH